jgi:thioester reductase-like protein
LGSNLGAIPTARPYALLTGATGLLGQYILRDLLRAGQPVAVLVRPTKKASARERVDSLLQRFDRETESGLPRPVVLSGDISDSSLRLSREDLEFVESRCSRLIHNAAVLQFQGESREGEPWATNVAGTRNVLDFCRESGIETMHYVSTAYTCGKRDGRILESDLDCGQEFRNDYERSKFEAELMVRQASHLASTTIYRPVVIAGDSRTGYTSTYHGLFVYLRLFSLFVPHLERGPDGRILTAVKIPLDGDEPRNVVPVDWVSRVFRTIFDNPSLHNQTYHLAPERFLTARQVIEACYDHFNSFGVEFCGAGQNSDQNGDFQPDYARQIVEQVSVYSQYETSDPVFDTRNLRAAIGDLRCPEIDHQMILRFLRFGESDLWGKRRQPPVDCVSGEQVEHQLHDIARVERVRGEPVGVRLLGPGGGDWTLYRSAASGELVCQRGIVATDIPVIIRKAGAPVAKSSAPVLVLGSAESEIETGPVKE